MGRILLGLCRVGAWGCFRRIQSTGRIYAFRSVPANSSNSSALNSICPVLRPRGRASCRTVKVHSSCAVFITMNPDYAGRSALPDNLKKLFRSIAMTHPDKDTIAEVTFYAQVSKAHELWVCRLFSFFTLCAERFSGQAHYDFGLRALKSTLETSGALKRRISTKELDGENIDSPSEVGVVLRSLIETIQPKLVDQDIRTLRDIVADVYPGIEYVDHDDADLRACVSEQCKIEHVRPSPQWAEKLFQVNKVMAVHHGVMLVGAAASGKSQTWRILSKALELRDTIEISTYVIDAKTMTKESLYGKLDSTTREWSDGTVHSHIAKDC
ncbi:hypothetical protein MRB53_039586 [Persea americana]|nr:hypothetical protein MRB53_039586 [Persea americana]